MLLCARKSRAHTPICGGRLRGGWLRGATDRPNITHPCTNLGLAWWPGEPRIEASKTCSSREGAMPRWLTPDVGEGHLMSLFRLVVSAALMLSQLGAAAAQE